MGAKSQLAAQVARDGVQVRRAWIAVALIPVFFVLAFAVGQALYSVFGYLPEDNDAPLWVDLASAIPTLAICLVPCVAAVLYGRRADRAGDRRALAAVVIGALAGLGLTVLTIVTTVADALRA
jgi:hypothetical protein